MFIIILIIFCCIVGLGVYSTIWDIESSAQTNIENNKKKFIENVINRGFVISKEIHYGKVIIAVDDMKKKWVINHTSSGTITDNPIIFDYSQLLEFDVKENGKQILQGRSGSSVVGGLLFGATGAVIGSSRKRDIDQISTIELNLTINDLDNNNITLLLLSNAHHDSTAYQNTIKFTQEVASLCSYIQNNK